MWDQPPFSKRVRDRAAQLGTSIRDVMRAARVKSIDSFLQGERKNGPAIGTVIEIAAELGVPLEELCGLGQRAPAALNFDYLEAAVRAAAIVQECETEDRVKLQQTARIIASMYEEFSRRGGIPSEEGLEMLAVGVKLRRRLTLG